MSIFTNSKMWFSTIVFLLFTRHLSPSEGSLYDPHVFPTKGPFFEGWYLRVTDFTNSDSFGFLFGSVLPEASSRNTAPKVVVSILRRKCSGLSGTCKLTSVDETFRLDQLNITVAGGKPVSRKPDRKSPPNFRWEVNNKSYGGYFEQISNKTSWAFRNGDLLFRGEADGPVAWDSSGSGPEGWISYLPLPLSWFVFSLRSRLVHYDITNVTSGETQRSQHGVVHMEKNWGKSFPKRWIWSEGAGAEDTNASYAISGGPVDLSFISITAYLIGYRNPSTGTILSFSPINSYVSTIIDGCTGVVNITINSVSYKVNIDISGKPTTFSSCLLGPETQGFAHACVETYDATTRFRISKRKSFLSSGLMGMEEFSFTNTALEFGGLNVCNQTCNG